jgi:hypothetical protein
MNAAFFPIAGLEEQVAYERCMFFASGEGARFRLHREGHTISTVPVVTQSSQSTEESEC